MTVQAIFASQKPGFALFAVYRGSSTRFARDASGTAPIPCPFLVTPDFFPVHVKFFCITSIFKKFFVGNFFYKSPYQFLSSTIWGMKIYKNDFFTVFSDNENLNNQQKIFNALNENLSRIMSFFEIKKISKSITVCIHSDLEEWRNFFNSLGSQYQDYVVGCAWEGKIDVLAFEEYQKTQMHKDDSFDDFLKVVIHEFVHICTERILRRRRRIIRP